MTKQRIARLAPECAPMQGQASPKQDQRIPDYVLRGLGLVGVAQDLILDSYQGGGRWIVPSGSDPDRSYEVRTGTRPARSRCECRGFGSHGHCSHLVAASRVARKSAVCDGCGQRTWSRDLSEVQESLTYFEGDLLCPTCSHGSDAEDPVVGFFELGRVVATPSALEELGQAGISPLSLLQRHASGDWGEVDAHDEEFPLPHDWARVIHLAPASVTFVTNTLRGFEDYL